jgi:hypothetical protein
MTAPSHERATIPEDVEISAEAMEGLLHAFMAGRVCQRQDLLAQVAVGGHEDAASV